MPLAELAKVRTDEGRNSILRTDQARRVVVSYQFADEILDSQPLLDAARAQVRTMVQDLVLPRRLHHRDRRGRNRRDLLLDDGNRGGADLHGPGLAL